MKGTLGLILLTVGLILAASFGARNGDSHFEHRKAVGEVRYAGGDAKTEAEARLAATPLPDPWDRLDEWRDVGQFGLYGGLLLIIIGATLARRQIAEDNAGNPESEEGRVDFLETLATVRKRLEQIQSDIASLPLDAESDGPRAAIDSINTDLLEPLVDGRGQLIARHGLAGFAEYFGTYSGAERNLNRCWSALTDGHSVVAREALSSSIHAFGVAMEQYEAVEARG